MKYRQDPPFAVQIELSQGCNLGCDFCGIHAIGYQKKQRGFDTMKVETLTSLVDQMVKHRWNPRIEFAMHGEPTMHPVIDVMVRTVRERMPKAFIMITSNGGGLLGGDVKAKVKALFDAGLNTLALDNYDSVNIVPKIVEKLLGQPYDAVYGDVQWAFGNEDNGRERVEVKWYPADKTASPHNRHRGRLISVVADISKAPDGTHATLNNHAGSAFAMNDRGAGKRCAKPFREMSVRWDGNVAICCNDWPGYYRCGNVVKDGLDAVWNSAAMYAARQMLIEGNREFGPCQGCDATSYRVGLLPDKLGKATLPKPSAATKAAIKEALRRGPYTKPVRDPIAFEE